MVVVQAMAYEVAASDAGLEVIHPGIVEVSAWRANAARTSALRVLGGVGRKR